MLLNQLTASSEQQPVANGFGFWVLGSWISFMQKVRSKMVTAKVRSPCPMLVFQKFRSFDGNLSTAPTSSCDNGLATDSAPREQGIN
jgi:hypothetical protein